MFGLVVAKKPYLIKTLGLALKYMQLATCMTIEAITHLMMDIYKLPYGYMRGLVSVSVKFSALYLVSKVSGIGPSLMISYLYAFS